MNLQTELEQWNGKEVASLQEIYDRCCSHPDFLTDAIEACHKQENLQIGGAWMVKQYVCAGGFLEELEEERWIAAFPKANVWISKLLLLQTIKHVPMPPQSRGLAENFVRQCLQQENKFVRAWAYSGFYTLSRQFTDLAQEADLLMEAGLKEEAPSVKAAIRKATLAK